MNVKLANSAVSHVTGFQSSSKERFLLARIPALASPKTILPGIRAIIDTSGSMGGKNRHRIEVALKTLRSVCKDNVSLYIPDAAGLKYVSDAEFSKIKCWGPTNWKSFRSIPDFANATGYLLLTDGDDLSPQDIETFWVNWGRKPIWLLLLNRNIPPSLALSAKEVGGCISFFSSEEENRLEKKILGAVADISLGARISLPQDQSAIPLFGRLSSQEGEEAFFVIPVKDGKNQIRISNFQGETIETLSEPGTENDRKMPNWLPILPVRQRILTLQAREQTRKIAEEITKLGLSNNLVTDYTAFLAVPEEVAAKHADALNPAFLAAFAVPNFKKAREQARGKACYANLRVLMGAVEMYNMDSPIPFPTDPTTCMIKTKKLIEGSYLKNEISKPESYCDYRFGPGGTLAANSAPFCLAHGFVDDLDVATLEESFIKRGADPYSFDIDFSQFKSVGASTPLQQWIEK
ncbi:hypothetical protein HYY75_12825, partial [bacterium]|nr:hypothetical protein [bacterium]